MFSSTIRRGRRRFLTSTQKSKEVIDSYFTPKVYFFWQLSNLGLSLFFFILINKMKTFLFRCFFIGSNLSLDVVSLEKKRKHELYTSRCKVYEFLSYERRSESQLERFIIEIRSGFACSFCIIRIRLSESANRSFQVPYLNQIRSGRMIRFLIYK